jgi:HAD superfamily hydrolase (TIGR01490 family)
MADAAAFLDFDRTLVDCDAGVVFGRALAARRFEDLRDAPLSERIPEGLKLAREAGSILLQEGAIRLLYRAHMLRRSRVVEGAYELLEGLPASEVYERAEEVFHETIADRFYPLMLEEVRTHREEGRRIVIVTTGMRELVRHATDYLGEADIIAVDLEEEGGRFTGEVTGPLQGNQKRIAVERYGKEEDLDLEASYAYSDHASDLPFLEAVGHPVAVNPDDALREVAGDRGWRVLTPERAREREA